MIKNEVSTRGSCCSSKKIAEVLDNILGILYFCSYFILGTMLILFNFGKDLVHKYLGFLNDTFVKVLFYIILTALALGIFGTYLTTIAFFLCLAVFAASKLTRYYKTRYLKR